MKQFLRSIRESKWLNCSNTDEYKKGDLRGDALVTIKTSCCQLSVFRVNDGNDRQRVITALAATRDNVDRLDYAIFEDSALNLLGITVEKTYGHTPDVVANELHYQLGELTATRLAQLAEIIYAGKHDYKPKKQIKFGLEEAVRSNQLDTTKCKESLLKGLEI